MGARKRRSRAAHKKQQTVVTIGPKSKFGTRGERRGKGKRGTERRLPRNELRCTPADVNAKTRDAAANGKYSRSNRSCGKQTQHSIGSQCVDRLNRLEGRRFGIIRVVVVVVVVVVRQ